MGAKRMSRLAVLRKALAVSLAAVFVLAACGDSSSSSPSDSSSDSDLAVTFDGEACQYDGPDQFSIGTVSFTVLNDSDEPHVGFAVWEVPAGTTVDDIVAEGMLKVGIDGVLGPGGAVSGRSAIKNPPGQEFSMETNFETAGTYAVHCFYIKTNQTQVDVPALIVEVK
jgi:hypothetical protein